MDQPRNFFNQTFLHMLESSDSYGNTCQRLVAPPGPLMIYTSAEAWVDDHQYYAPGAWFIEIQHLPNDVLVFCALVATVNRIDWVN